jgi:hypothetical protein
MNRIEIAMAMPADLIPQDPPEELLEHVAEIYDIDLVDEDDPSRFIRTRLAYDVFVRHSYAELMMTK